MLFMGVDAGTQGVRAIVSDGKGEIVTAGSCAYKRINIIDEPGRFEQSPSDWYRAVSDTIKACVGQLKSKGINPKEIVSLSVDGTSGTVLPVDSDHNPLMNAVMYNDSRATAQAGYIHGEVPALEARCGYKFNASFALPKILWIRENDPRTYDRTYAFLHQADYMIGKLCGTFHVTDYSNALKTGYDIADERWPEEIANIGIDMDKLPKVAAPGSRIGDITASFANETGLCTSTYVTAGATDGYASALAAGAIDAGDWASIIGTTFVIKGVTKDLLIDREGSAYSHKMPSGMYMLGGASNVGGKCIDEKFAKDELDDFNRYVDGVSPTGVITYPLVGKGERFPFLDPEAQSFIQGDAGDRKVLYAALMEGVGFVERLSLDRMIKMGAKVGDVINTSGGACRSDEWLRVRASILNRQLKVPKTIEAAMGSAILAASHYFGTLKKAAKNMIRFEKVIDPDHVKTDRFNALYFDFIRECKRRYGIGDFL